MSSDLLPLVTMDQVISRRAKTHDRTSILSYAGENDFAQYTGAEIERLSRYAANAYAEILSGLKEGSSKTVAMVGISNMEYYITFIALQRVGITAMLISPRLPDQGFAHLLRKTNCNVAITSKGARKSLERACKSANMDVSILPMLDAEDFATTTFINRFGGPLKPVDTSDQQGFIIHSGGTTGLPKPVRLYAKAWLLQAANVASRMPQVDTLTTLPLFHSFGVATLLRCLVNGRCLSIMNASRPITASTVLSGLEKTYSEALVTVPYILKFFTEIDGGVERLAQLRQVISAGSAIPDDLGNQISDAGAKIYHLYGQTESGALMEACQDQWNWVTPLPSAKPFLKFEPVGDDIYHLIVLPGLPTKVLSEREDGSYPTKDLFQRHPTDPSKWKFVARQDDIIVLVNGEKADPIPLEDAVRKHPNVKAAVVFGAQKDSLGMIVIPSERAAKLDLSAPAIIESILPNLALGNSRVPAYARISSEAIIVKEPDVPLPMTDKATIIRSRFLKQFEKDIDNYYTLEEVSGNGKKATTPDEVREFVRQVVTEQLDLDEQKRAEFTDESDLFSLGMDSLQATNVRSRILKGVELDGQSLATNVVFDHPTVDLLASHLIERRAGRGQKGPEPQEVALEMIRKYSDFVKPWEIGTMTVDKDCVLLTGATGSIGAHILSSLVLRNNVSKVVCLVRADDDQAALLRVKGALRKMRLLEHLSAAHMDKILALPCSLSDEHLGLSQSTYNALLTSVTCIIHNAWPVNFNMNLQSFEQSGTLSTHNLINLALQSQLQQKPTFVLISSLAAVLQAQPLPIPERRHGWEGVAPMGYGQSKWVAEEICAAAAEKTGLNTRVVRIGQVAGDTQHGIWSASEAFPTTVQCALTIGALPVVEGEDEELSWLPVDKTAATVVDLSLLDRADVDAASAVPAFSLFHVANPSLLKWNMDFLPALKRQGLQFEALPQREWLRRLEDNPDVSKNPAYKLVDFFKQKYGRVSETSVQPTLDVTLTRQFSPSLKKETIVDDALVGKFLKYWTEHAWSS
ncbi:hypothetical protein JOL62DRAFT_356142 [Phyllosticta paracitricarpa]|uniref:Carrier domain-containing protein n=1 Tax=Phyllosticta paracitricarpa TaxID=2016321 RepID=A0ABR1NFW0_9PEZI